MQGSMIHTLPERIILRNSGIFKCVLIYNAPQKQKWRLNVMNLEQIQEALQSERLDGWLFYDFRKSNPIAYQILSIPLNSFFSRRWFYFVPTYGTPTALVSAVE